MKRTRNQSGYHVDLIDSPAGQVRLVKRGLTTRDLATAIEEWTPDRPGAFDDPPLNIPWVQILELLGRVPKNTTGEFLESGGNLQ